MKRSCTSRLPRQSEAGGSLQTEFDEWIEDSVDNTTLAASVVLLDECPSRFNFFGYRNRSGSLAGSNLVLPDTSNQKPFPQKKAETQTQKLKRVVRLLFRAQVSANHSVAPR